jgi:glycosyltransferase involved in cell wall biosynthesis
LAAFEYIPTAMTQARKQLPLVIVGPSFRFYSGISVYTNRLSQALSGLFDVRVVLLRRLLPQRLFPGAKRVGQVSSVLTYRNIDTYDGIDWYWIPSIFPAVCRLVARRSCVVLQWWTASVAHTYVLLALIARVRGSRVIIEFHEVQDPGEAQIPGAGLYARLTLPILLRLSDGAVVHTAHGGEVLRATHRTGHLQVQVISHGPYDHFGTGRGGGVLPSAEHRRFRLLFFGLIRRYKGVEDLVRAFSNLPRSEVEGLELVVAGETWEGWTMPAELIAASPHSDRIRFINRYIADEEVRELFATCDALVLPYRRASSSGPLHIAMSIGLPVVTYDIAAMRDAAGDYRGTRFVPADDIDALGLALITLSREAPVRHQSPVSWEATAEGYRALVDRLQDGGPERPAGERASGHFVGDGSASGPGHG